MYKGGSVEIYLSAIATYLIYLSFTKAEEICIFLIWCTIR